MTSSHILKKSVKSLPLKWYYDDKHHTKEVSKIWSKEWFYACHENALNDPLSYITVNIDNFNVIGQGRLGLYPSNFKMEYPERRYNVEIKENSAME